MEGFESLSGDFFSIILWGNFEQVRFFGLIFQKKCGNHVWSVFILDSTICRDQEKNLEMLCSCHSKLPHSFLDGVIINFTNN